MDYIYSRVSMDKQTVDNQVSTLKQKFPGAQVVEETALGTKRRRELELLLAKLCEGDRLIVFALDRLGRRTSEVLAIIEDLEKRKVVLVSLREGVDYSTICGKLVTQILCSVAEMERNLISERTKAALAARKLKGVKLGKPPKYDDRMIMRIKKLREKGMTLEEISKETGVSRSRVHILSQK